MEIWKDIEGYNGYYQVSNLGNVKNVQTQKILNGDTNSIGYKRVVLYKPIKKRFFVHRLVAYHFVDGYNKNLIVNHKDGNKQNNIADNLEWITHSENDKHAFKHNLRMIQGAALIQQQKSQRNIQCINIQTQQCEYIFDNLDDCAQHFHKNREYIRQCCKGMYNLQRKYKLLYIE
jgi:hypothetical protein